MPPVPPDRREGGIPSRVGSTKNPESSLRLGILTILQLLGRREEDDTEPITLSLTLHPFMGNYSHRDRTDDHRTGMTENFLTRNFFHGNLLLISFGIPRVFEWDYPKDVVVLRIVVDPFVETLLLRPLE
jgi:hypothetical protein